MKPKEFSIAGPFIVTAENGKIPLNSKVVCEFKDAHIGLLMALTRQASAYPKLIESLRLASNATSPPSEIQRNELNTLLRELGEQE